MSSSRLSLAAIARAHGLAVSPDWGGVDAVWPLFERAAAERAAFLLKVDGERGPNGACYTTVLSGGRLGKQGFSRADARTVEDAMSPPLVEYYSKPLVSAQAEPRGRRLAPARKLAPGSKLALALEVETMGIDLDPDWTGLDPLLSVLELLLLDGAVLLLRNQQRQVDNEHGLYVAGISAGRLMPGERVVESADSAVGALTGATLSYLRSEAKDY